jgi:hypothetical protein
MKTAAIESPTGQDVSPIMALSLPTYDLPKLPAKLTPKEFDRLIELEKEFESLKPSFERASEILLEIRDKQLWRQDFKSFQAYCVEKLGIGARRGRQIADAAKIIKNLENGNHGSALPLPTNERQIRELLAVLTCAIFDRMVDREIVKGEKYVGAEEKVERTKTDPGVLKLAKKIFGIAMEAADYKGKWDGHRSEAQAGFMAIAKWHLGEILSLARVVDEEAELRSQRPKLKVSMHKQFNHPAFPGLKLMVIGWEDGASENPCHWGMKLWASDCEKTISFKSPNDCEEKLDIEIKEFDARRTEAKSPSKADKTSAEESLYVICREAKGQKPRYWSGPNAWTIDPTKARHLARKAAGARLTHTKGFASCKADFMMSLAKAVRRFGAQ